MTNIEDELTVALQRRAETVAVEDHLDAIVDDMNIIRFSAADRARPRRSRLLTAAAATAVLAGAGSLIWVNSIHSQVPAASSAPKPPIETGTANSSGSLPAPGPATISRAWFPDDVPWPDTLPVANIMSWDNAAVGWEFHDQGVPTDSVERCTEYADLFGPTWTATAITDEAPAVLYAQSLSNTDWRVGIYCVDDGGFLVQVVREATSDLVAFVQSATHIDPDRAEFATEVRYRAVVYTESLVALGYTIASIDSASDTHATIRAESAVDDRTIVVTMTPATMTPATVLLPENHERVPMVVLGQDDLQIRGQVNSNNGWVFEISADRSSTDGPLPSPTELQALLYALVP